MLGLRLWNVNHAGYFQFHKELAHRMDAWNPVRNDQYPYKGDECTASVCDVCLGIVEEHSSSMNNAMKGDLDVFREKQAQYIFHIEGVEDISNSNDVKSAIDNNVEFYRNNDSILKQTDDETKAISERFDSELGLLMEGKLESGHVFDMGRPGDKLIKTGIPDLPIKMKLSQLKIKMEKHSFGADSIKGLVNELSNPLAIFAYGNRHKAQNVIVDIIKGDEHLLVGLQFTDEYQEGNRIEVRGLFFKEDSEWISLLETEDRGKKELLFADKERILEFINQTGTNFPTMANKSQNPNLNVVWDKLDVNGFAKSLSVEDDGADSSDSILAQKVTALEAARSQTQSVVVESMADAGEGSDLD